MVSFPNCKINIGLNILSKREDGYHNLQTVFYPFPLKDVLEIIEAPDTARAVAYSHSGLDIYSKEENNLCIKAWHLLKKDFPSLPAIQMHLHKVIPMGAGLGGGSADAAFALKMLNEKFTLGLSSSHLIHYSLQLGSDCPFFVLNKPCYATGRGEILEPLPLDLSAYAIVIVNPRIHVNTGLAFKNISVGKNAADLKQLIAAPLTQWKQHIVNDFEEPVFKQYPAIEAIKIMLYQKGALYASMSGSGSTVFGIFEKEIALSFPEEYFVKWGGAGE